MHPGKVGCRAEANRIGHHSKLVLMEALGSTPPIFVVDENSFTVTLPARELELWRNEGRRRYEVRD